MGSLGGSLSPTFPDQQLEDKADDAQIVVDEVDIAYFCQRIPRPECSLDGRRTAAGAAFVGFDILR